MAHVIPNGLKQYLLDGTIMVAGNYADTLKAALFDKDFVPDKDAHDSWADIGFSEMVGEGYPEGGVELGARSASHDDELDRGVLAVADVVFPNITLTDIRWVVIYAYRPPGFWSPEQYKIVCFYDLGENLSPQGVNFTVKFPNGLLTVAQGS